MTDTPKPLTADEIADAKKVGWHPQGFPARLIATIEQRDEHIEKLRDALDKISAGFLVNHSSKWCLEIADAATEPPK